MLLETCRYKIVDGKVVTKMFGMKGGDWDIEPGWHHDKKAAKAAEEEPEVKIVSAKVWVDENEPENKPDDESEAGGVKASPHSRKLAKELGVDINEVVGTGKNGCITKGDVQSHQIGETESDDDNSSGFNQ